MNKRELQKIETKRKIFKVSIELFKEFGFDNVSIEKICNTCEIAKGTFYVHYKSKSEILIEKYADLDYIYEKKYNSLKLLDIDTISFFKLYIQAIYVAVEEYFGIDMIQTLYVHHLKQYDYEILLNKNRFFYKSIIEFFELISNEYNLEEDSLYLSNLLLSSIRGNIFDWAISNGELDLVELGSKRANTLLDLIVSKK